ncbi:unnamed protein product [Musa hybrid cultivar]
MAEGKAGRGGGEGEVPAVRVAGHQVLLLQQLQHVTAPPLLQVVPPLLDPRRLPPKRPHRRLLPQAPPPLPGPRRRRRRRRRGFEARPRSPWPPSAGAAVRGTRARPTAPQRPGPGRAPGARRAVPLLPGRLRPRARSGARVRRRRCGGDGFRAGAHPTVAAVAAGRGRGSVAGRQRRGRGLPRGSGHGPGRGGVAGPRHLRSGGGWSRAGEGGELTGRRIGGVIPVLVSLWTAHGVLLAGVQRPILSLPPTTGSCGFSKSRGGRCVVPLAMSAAASGDSDGSTRLSMDAIRKLFDGFPQPVKSFPWMRVLWSFQNIICELVWAVAKYLSVPLLAVTSLSEMSYCAHERKMGVIPIPVVVGFAVAGCLKDAAEQFSSDLKEGGLPWHLLLIASFFALLKLPGPSYPYWGRLLIPHLANGGLWRTIWLIFMWYRRPNAVPGASL